MTGNKLKRYFYKSQLYHRIQLHSVEGQGGGCANTANSSYVPFFSWYKEVDTDRLILLCFVIMSCLAFLGDMGKLYWKYVK